MSAAIVSLHAAFRGHDRALPRRLSTRTRPSAFGPSLSTGKSALVANGARGRWVATAMPWCSYLFVDADGALEHRAGVVAFVPDCFEHPGGQRVELALNRVVSSQLGVLQQRDQQEGGGGERGSGCLLVGSAGTKRVPSEPGEHEREAEHEEGRRAREIRCPLGDFVKAATTVCFTASDGMLQRHQCPSTTTRLAADLRGSRRRDCVSGSRRPWWPARRTADLAGRLNIRGTTLTVPPSAVRTGLFFHPQKAGGSSPVRASESRR